jgi:hypothetical protein
LSVGWLEVSEVTTGPLVSWICKFALTVTQEDVRGSHHEKI